MLKPAVKPGLMNCYGILRSNYLSKVIDLAKQLIACPSITPKDAGCQEILIARLTQMGFQIELLPFGPVNNFWARRGTAAPLFVYAGHTDVVPTGPLEKWTSPPFQPEIRDGHLYGRGAADMKGSVAAMLVACENFIAAHPDHKGSIAWLITSDEEGLSIDGTAKVVEVLEKRQEKMDWCLVGEASSDHQLGDTLKIGRRGTLSGKLTIHGRQGHVAYPQHADNPIHKTMPMLNELINIHWDQGNDFFQPTSLQISNIHAGTGANNVIPGNLEVQFNFRFSPETTEAALKTRVENLLKQHPLKFNLEWLPVGQPFLTKPGKLVTACSAAVESITGLTPILATNGGTSDGRFIAPTGCQVVELGPCNHSIHQINECVGVDELTALAVIYEKILAELLA